MHGRLRRYPHKEDVFPDHGVWSIKITPDAGDLKNASSERNIPLHPCLVKRGFLDFLKDKPRGPLFFNRARRRETSSAKPGKGATNHLREFLHGVAKREGLKIGREFRKDPNHAWRHRFVTEARKHSMDNEKREYALGHALGDEGYGGMAGTVRNLVCWAIVEPLEADYGDQERDSGPASLWARS